jgi:phage gpG-like protein
MEGAFVTADLSSLKFWFRALEDRAVNLKEVNRLLVAAMIERIDDNFETEGHGEWRKLADSTLERRRGEGKDAKILQDTGRLAASINQGNSEVGNDFAEVFTNVSYAKYHVSSAPRTKIPLRDFLDIHMDSFLEEASGILVEQLVNV